MLFLPVSLYPIVVAARQAERYEENEGERSSLLWAGGSAQREEQRGKVVKAALYGLQVFYSFFIM